MAVTGVQRYRTLVGISGARAPLILSTAGSMPIGMFGLAILLMAHDATGSFAQAGRVVGAFGLANALGAVAQGRLMDRVGQTRVLRTAACGHLPALIALVAAANAGASAWALSLLALCGGGTLPQLSAAMRSLWNALVEASSYETAVLLGGTIAAAGAALALLRRRMLA
jgi:MFS family permease